MRRPRSPGRSRTVSARRQTPPPRFLNSDPAAPSRADADQDREPRDAPVSAERVEGGRLRGWPSRVLRLAVPAVMCHAEARAQDARRRACRHRLKMVGPSKASPTQRHNDRGQTEPPHAITPPSRDPPRGRQIADRGGSPSFLRHPRSPNARHLSRHAWARGCGPSCGTSTTNQRPTPTRPVLYGRLMADTPSATTARPAARAGADQAQHASGHEPRPTAHDDSQTSPTYDRPALPAFCWPAVTLEGDTPGRVPTRRHRSRAERRRRVGRLEPKPSHGQHSATERRSQAARRY